MVPKCARLLVLLAASLVLAAPASAAQRSTIRTSTAGNFRAVLVATRGPSLTATVTIAVSVRQHGSWHSEGSRTVGSKGMFFWYPITAPGAVRSFHINGSHQKVSFQLVITPSIGVSQTFRFHVSHGHLAAG